MNTNYVWLLVSLLFTGTASLAQREVSPSEEYRVHASASTITLGKGQRDSVRIMIVRSRSFKAGKPFFSVEPPAVTGLTTSMKQNFSQADEFTVYVSATGDAMPGEYSITPICLLRGRRKGIVLKLIIN